MDELSKIYVEPTNRCNLTCVTCVRNSWDEPFGDMDWPVYQALIDGLAAFPEAKTIAFAGFGEPLTHKRFPDMVRLAHERGLRTEMTSNAMLLTPSLAGQLVDAGLDHLPAREVLLEAVDDGAVDVVGKDVLGRGALGPDHDDLLLVGGVGDGGGCRNSQGGAGAGEEAAAIHAGHRCVLLGWIPLGGDCTGSRGKGKQIAERIAGGGRASCRSGSFFPRLQSPAWPV